MHVHTYFDCFGNKTRINLRNTFFVKELNKLYSRKVTIIPNSDRHRVSS